MTSNTFPVQCRRIAPSNNSMTLNRPTKLLVDEIDMRNATLTIRCCVVRAAAIASEIEN